MPTTDESFPGGPEAPEGLTAPPPAPDTRWAYPPPPGQGWGVGWGHEGEAGSPEGWRPDAAGDDMPPPAPPWAYPPSAAQGADIIWQYSPPPPPPPPPASPQGLRGGQLIAALIVLALVCGVIGGGITVAARRISSHVAAPRPSLAPSGGSGSPQFGGSPAFPPFGGGSAPAPSSGGRSSGSLNQSGITAAVNPAVVNIRTILGGQGGQAAGTGMVLTPSGEILTNNHVIDGATTISVQINGTGPTYSARVVGYDITDDVAVLQMQNVSGLKTVVLGDSAKVKPGDPVVAIGDAGGAPGPPTATQGAVSAIDQTITVSDTNGGGETLSGLIQMDAPLQPGDSGGPLVNAAGQVIGMDTAANGGYRRFSSSTVGFAIPINAALSVAHQIESGNGGAKIHIGSRAMLGVEIQDVSSQGSGSGFGNGGSAPVNSGALVAGVSAGSPAESAGMAAGDVITSLAGAAVRTAADLTAAMDAHHPGDKVQVGWTDKSGQQHSATVQLIAGPPA
jgi:S1-C subfamily serine protease